MYLFRGLCSWRKANGQLRDVTDEQNFDVDACTEAYTSLPIVSVSQRLQGSLTDLACAQVGNSASEVFVERACTENCSWRVDSEEL